MADDIDIWIRDMAARDAIPDQYRPLVEDFLRGASPYLAQPRRTSRSASQVDAKEPPRRTLHWGRFAALALPLAPLVGFGLTWILLHIFL